MITHLFLDAAGTLIHPTQPVGQTYATIAAQHGLHTTPEAMTQAFAQTFKTTPAPHYPEGQTSPDDDKSWWQHIVYQTFQKTHLLDPKTGPTKTHETCFEALYTHFADPKAWSLYPDTLPFIEEATQTKNLLLLSNFDTRLRHILEGHQILHHFQHQIISSEIGVSKPHPRIFQAALKAAQIDPKNALHIGDHPLNDAQGARAAGIPVYLLNRPETTLKNALQFCLQYQNS